MVKNQNLHSLEIEKTCIGGLLKHPGVFAEIDAKTKPLDFYIETNSNIYGVLKVCLTQKEKVDGVILAQKLQNLGISEFGDLDIFSYISSLQHTQISKSGLIEAFDELVKLRVCREICENAEDVKTFVHENKEKKVPQIISGVDGIYNGKIESFINDEGPIDLYSHLYDLVTNFKEDSFKGLITPFKNFNKWFGHLRAGNGVYALAARSKAGKSNFLFNMSQGVSLLNDGVKSLILDTEMDKNISAFRAGAAAFDVGMYFLESGSYKKHPEMEEKVVKALSTVKNLKGKIFHKNVANIPIDEVVSIAKQWYYRECGRGNPGLITYDYLKITSESLGQNWAEYQAMGEKINRLNELGIKINCPIWTAIQLNRSGIMKNDSQDFDESSVSISDRLSWYAAWLGGYRKKTPDELGRYGTKWGSHLLKVFVSRFLGEDYPELVKIKSLKKGEKDKYCQNFINFNFENFRVSERGTLGDIVKDEKDKINVQDNTEREAGL